MRQVPGRERDSLRLNASLNRKCTLLHLAHAGTSNPHVGTGYNTNAGAKRPGLAKEAGFGDVRRELLSHALSPSAVRRSQPTSRSHSVYKPAFYKQNYLNWAQKHQSLAKFSSLSSGINVWPCKCLDID